MDGFSRAVHPRPTILINCIRDVRLPLEALVKTSQGNTRGSFAHAGWDMRRLIRAKVQLGLFGPARASVDLTSMNSSLTPEAFLESVAPPLQSKVLPELLPRPALTPSLHSDAEAQKACKAGTHASPAVG